MSVRNGERFLEEAMKSILNQSFGDFEFIVMDNASTDHTVDIISSFNDSRVRLVRNEKDLGQTRALNVGLGLAKGPFLARMDADDVSLPHRFERQRDSLRTYPETAVVGSWHQEIDEKGHYLKTMRYPADPLDIKCHLLSDGDLTRRCLAHPTVMMRTEVLKKVGGYSESVRFAQDYELWTRLMEDYDLRNVPEVLFQYRASKKSTSNTNRADMERELDGIVDRLIRRLWPDVDSVTCQRLTAMLRNKPLLFGTEGRELHDAFDELFSRLFKREKLSNQQLALRERIKMYYWPRLASHDFSSAMSALRLGVGRDPFVFADMKFHKNIGKTFFRK